MRGPTSRADRRLREVVAALVLVQVVVGAAQRVLPSGRAIHLILALAILMTAIPAGVRGWVLDTDRPAVRRAGKLLLAATGVQMALGACLLLAPASLAVRTAHRAMAAILLAAAFLGVGWGRRFVAPADPPQGSGVNNPSTVPPKIDASRNASDRLGS